MNPSRASAVLALIGNTPTVPLLFEPEGVTIYAKCEFRNPSGSVKDRFVFLICDGPHAMHSPHIVHAVHSLSP